MRKAILVMDMPESCSKCQFSYEFQGTKKCQLMNILYKRAAELSQNSFTMHRHDKCPLRELPEKMAVYGRIAASYKVGWNICIDAITGGER